MDRLLQAIDWLRRCQVCMAMAGTDRVPFLIIFHGLRSLYAEHFISSETYTVTGLTATNFTPTLLWKEINVPDRLPHPIRSDLIRSGSYKRSF